MAKAVILFITALFLASSCAMREQSAVAPDKPAVREAPAAETEPGAEPRMVEPEKPSPPADMRMVISDSLNVRSGPNINYEAMGVLSKGEPVEVLGSLYEWLEIALPAGWKGWVHSDYIELSSDFVPGGITEGSVKATRLNVRALPGTRYSVLTQVSRADKVAVIDRDGDWLGIDVSGLAPGWVHSQHVGPGR